MNTLIKFVITTVISFFGPLTELENAQVTNLPERSQNIEDCIEGRTQTKFCMYSEKNYTKC